MNTAAITADDAARASASVTFVCRSTSRGCEEFGPSDLLYVETVHASGRVDVHVTGESDGENVNQRAVRDEGRTFDLARVTAARLAAGWAVRP